ncbi:MAG: DNA-directed polymerase subunit alpha, partial [Herbinix sp.]|nr:DNA-directed polymerase subunit alpha [Herbinix sp.]
MSEELQELMDNNPEWYKDILLVDAKEFIRANINSASRSFVAIGYYLKYIRNNEMFTEDGYQSIWEFAKSEFGIGKSSASQFMSINDKFSKDGNSPILLDQYKDFTSSKLAEMLTMTDEQLEQITPTTTIVEIREIKKPAETILTSEQSEITEGPKTIDDLELSVRTYNCLKRADIDTVEELCELTEIEVIKIRNISQKCLDEIKEKLSKTGKSLKPDMPIGENGCTGECFWCADEDCNSYQEPREKCLFDSGVKCSIYGAHQVATTVCGVDCKSSCCMSCKEDCGARCNHSAHRDVTESVNTEPEYIETVSKSEKNVVVEPESVVEEVETVTADIIQTEPDETFTDQCETSGLKFNNWLKANGSSIADIVDVVLMSKKVPDEDNLYSQIKN